MKKFSTSTDGSIANGCAVLTNNLQDMQDGAEEGVQDIIVDFFNDGIVYTSSPIPFTITDNNDGTFSIGEGIGYKNGDKIEIASGDTTAYSSTNPTTTSTDGIGGTVLTPLNSGCISIPIATSTTYYVGIKYLQNCDTSLYSLRPITRKREYYRREDGYEIELKNNVSLITGLVIGTVTRGSGTALTIDYNGRTYLSLKTEVNRLATDVVDNSISTAKIVNYAVTEAKLASGVGFASGTRILFCQASAPIGWTQDTTFNDRALRITSGAGNVTGGSLVLSAATVGDHILTEAQMPSHRHAPTSVGSFAVNVAAGGSGALAAGNTVIGDNYTAYVGGGTAHNHALALAYLDVIVCTKN